MDSIAQVFHSSASRLSPASVAQSFQHWTLLKSYYLGDVPILELSHNGITAKLTGANAQAWLRDRKQ